jgi:hypothetical protein
MPKQPSHVYEVRLPSADMVFLVTAPTRKKAVQEVAEEVGEWGAEREPFEIDTHYRPKKGGIWGMRGTTSFGYFTETGKVVFH